jgi:hypothetical protein
MRNASTAFSVFLLLALSSTARAQALELPSLSPKARVEQRVGVTDFSLDYSSPGVKKRAIWGALVPWDKSWRAGANAPTKLTASRDFKFGGVDVKAGSYAIYMRPGKKQWTVHLSPDLNANQDNHDPSKDVAKVVVKPVAIPLRERLLFFFNNTQDNGTALEMEWEKVRIKVDIAVDTKGHAAAAIAKATGEAWRPHWQGASFYFDAGDTAQAMTLVDKSIAIQPTWRNEWLRARILHKQGNKTEAVAGANKALKLGAGDQAFEAFGKADINKTLATWK